MARSLIRYIPLAMMAYRWWQRRRRGQGGQQPGQGGQLQ